MSHCWAKVSHLFFHRSRFGLHLESSLIRSPKHNAIEVSRVSDLSCVVEAPRFTWPTARHLACSRRDHTISHINLPAFRIFRKSPFLRPLPHGTQPKVVSYSNYISRRAAASIDVYWIATFLLSTCQA